ncbi:hypothetical protein ACWEP3_27800, partial [Streptomyces albidoflavus]
MTAEAAVVLPALVVFLLALVWALLAVAAHIQCRALRAGLRLPLLAAGPGGQRAGILDLLGGHA